MLVATAEQCRAAGLPCEIVSCGGTLTYHHTATLPGVTEVQAGGGIFCDMQYRSRGVDHPIALSLLATVVSRPTPQRIIVDSGFKAFGQPVVNPHPRDIENVDESQSVGRARQDRAGYAERLRAGGGQDRDLRRLWGHDRLPPRRVVRYPQRLGRDGLAGVPAQQLPLGPVDIGSPHPGYPPCATGEGTTGGPIHVRLDGVRDADAGAEGGDRAFATARSAGGADGAPVGNEQVGPGDARRRRDDGEEIALDADRVAMVGQAEAATEPHAMRIHDNARR